MSDSFVSSLFYRRRSDGYRYATAATACRRQRRSIQSHPTVDYK